MNPTKNMIIAKGNIVTTSVNFCKYNAKSKKWDVTFNDGRTFGYNYENLVWLKNPERIDSEGLQVSYDNKPINHISEIYSYKADSKEYWYIHCSNGFEISVSKTDLSVSKSILKNEYSRSIFEYFKEVAALVSVTTEDNKSILSNQYEKIDYLSNRTAAAVYLAPDNYKNKSHAKKYSPIFPFGCNESQYNAVVNALDNQISVIEGPPGTGKTQTILNIIANLIIRDKTVQVVSNNNSAIDNIIEKLASPKYGMDFIAAQLGREQRKDAFISTQNGVYPDFSKWVVQEKNYKDLLIEAIEKSTKLQEIFKSKNYLAELKRVKYDVELEYKHLDSITNDTPLVISSRELSSEQIMNFWNEYQDIVDGKIKAGFLYRVIKLFKFGIKIKELINTPADIVINNLQRQFYETRIGELNCETTDISESLDKINADSLINDFTETSLRCFQAFLASRYGKTAQRRIFSKDDLWKYHDEFMNEYPVILSTTYTARSSLGKDAVFDYVIMDEASQVDVATGMLALSCASNAVIVGDTKQLPNVVTSKQAAELDHVFSHYDISESYNFTKHSLLSSICDLLNSVPRVTLCEHYRCHPQIIGFCNQKFYDGSLVVMSNSSEPNALQLVTTVAGSHARGRINQRQIDVIRTDILPELNYNQSEIGIIAPYNDQVNQLKVQLGTPGIDISTVHKFQGREKDAIILSTVDDVVSSFSDDPNLLNVAISRAKKKLIVVASDSTQPSGSNMSDLIGYIRYNNCDIKHSSISSVFDYLYKEYSDNRLEYLKKHNRVSEYDSENLMFALIQDSLKRFTKASLGVICHQSLQLLFTDLNKLNLEEQRFVNTGLSHLDFLIFNKVTKRPVLAIEVDGYNFHKEGTRQAERDKLKNHILEVYNLPLLRFSTNGSGEGHILDEKLHEIFADSRYGNADVIS